MFQFKRQLDNQNEINDFQDQVNAINKSQAVIEFELDGTILTANQNFLTALGYRLDEIKGRHHSLFVDPAEAALPAYRQFWDALARGEYQAAEYKRIAKGGREIWIQASYNPIMDRDGRAYKVVKYATDVTAAKVKNADYQGQLNAIHKSQAVIEFTPDGMVVNANENFLKTLGYQLHEIQGKHHSMFVEPAESGSAAYRQFWEALKRGEYQAAEYKRIGKGGKEVWIQASYNPILDLNGKTSKVIKYATDITAEKLKNADFQGQISAIHKSQAVIEFRPDGTVITANENFLKTLGYQLDEIKDKHHRMFVDPTEAAKPEYRQFWDALQRGEYQAAAYRRIGKGGREVWIQASYNPIVDLNGKVYKVVKFATDISTQKEVITNIVESIRKIQAAVEIVNAQAASASSGSLQTTANVQAVAAGAEELHASVEEISQSMDKSRNEVDNAVDKLTAANEETRKLAAAAQAMNGIVQLIQNIASQVNLLSLNATIEAARAGEAGKGFAVVATEVKTLAKQAEEATKKIEVEISGIQSVIDNVVGRLAEISTGMANVSGYVTGTAGAVEEQSAVTRDMSTNMQYAANAVQDGSKSLNDIVAAVSTVHTEISLTTKEAARLA